MNKPMTATEQALAAQVAELMAKIESMKPAARAVSMKVSEKGAVSIYGLGRFPVTLYASQFDKLDAAWPQVQAFVKANRASLSVKD